MIFAKINIVNMKFATTGYGIFTQDPAGIHMENITVDHSRTFSLLEMTLMQCNYPEAYTTNTVFINNVTQELSSDVFTYGITLGVASFGNQSISNVDCSSYSISPKNTMTCIVSIIRAT